MHYKICEMCKNSFPCSGAPRIGKDGRPLLNKPKVAYALDYGGLVVKMMVISMVAMPMIVMMVRWTR